MPVIKTKFSIKDLENFTGIKSHTIRIWEKRYNLLAPDRTDTNIRYYSNDDFIKLLNINLLYSKGFKISKIAQLSDEELLEKSKEITAKSIDTKGYLNDFKIAMLKFDTFYFETVYNNILKTKSFKEIFKQIFIPLLNHIGDLWQTKSIKPVHEHFISNLIVQKLYENIALIDKSTLQLDSIYVLYLPENESHELGLLYLHYELLSRGYTSIYLGQNIDYKNVADFKKHYNKVSFVSYFTIVPEEENISSYLNKVYNALIKETENKYYFLGRRVVDYIKTENYLPKNMTAYCSLKDFLKKI